MLFGYVVYNRECLLEICIPYARSLLGSSGQLCSNYLQWAKTQFLVLCLGGQQFKMIVPLPHLMLCKLFNTQSIVT